MPWASDDSLPLAAGKVPSALLARLLTRLPTAHEQLILGPKIGEDAAVIDWGKGYGAADCPLLVVKSDPITFATDEIGHYAVHVCANDLAVTGADPLFYLPTLLWPAAKTTAASVQHVFEQIGTACRALGVVVAAGHSEITAAVDRAIVAGTMVGRLFPQHMVHSGGGRPGDLVLMAGTAPVEGTSIIARERRELLLASGWQPDQLDRAANALYSPGISVLEPARAAARSGWVTAMHDPTEGGVVTGLRELALAADTGLEVDLDAVPVPPLSARLCAAFGLDPLGTIASGALLATAGPDQAELLLKMWQELGWPGVVIGRILPRDAGTYGLRAGRRVDLPSFNSDEITKLFTG